MFVELPEAGSTVSQGETFGSVESVKAVSDVNSPISGTVTETNTNIRDAPDTVSHDQLSLCLFVSLFVCFLPLQKVLGVSLCSGFCLGFLLSDEELGIYRFHGLIW